MMAILQVGYASFLLTATHNTLKQTLASAGVFMGIKNA